MTSYFPDVNFWVALTHDVHQHHRTAVNWFAGLRNDTCYFCRFTQLGYFRLLTQPSVMGEDAKSQREAWAAYDLLTADERVGLMAEPEGGELEISWREFTNSSRSRSQQWPDTYLASFAVVAGLHVVTFDRALHRLCGANAVLLA